MTVVLENSVRPATIFESLWQQIDVFEQRFSRFLATSELSKFNAAAGTRQTISQPFRDLLLAARDMAEKTDGLYNPCTLPALQRAGYKGSWPTPQKSNSKLDYEDRVIADWHDIIINDTSAKIPADAALDFGGIGKGYLLDEVAETLAAQSITNYWLSLGGDIICAGHDAAGDSWRIGIQDAQVEEKVIASVKNDGRMLAIATSGITKRQGISDAGPWHHIIDPRTGKPAKTDVLTATVCADTAILADIAAKCLVIAGTATAESILPTIGITDALLQANEAGKHKIVKIGTAWLA